MLSNTLNYTSVLLCRLPIPLFSGYHCILDKIRRHSPPSWRTRTSANEQIVIYPWLRQILQDRCQQFWDDLDDQRYLLKYYKIPTWCSLEYQPIDQNYAYTQKQFTEIILEPILVKRLNRMEQKEQFILKVWNEERQLGWILILLMFMLLLTILQRLELFCGSSPYHSFTSSCAWANKYFCNVRNFCCLWKKQKPNY